MFLLTKSNINDFGVAQVEYQFESYIYTLYTVEGAKD